MGQTINKGEGTNIIRREGTYIPRGERTSISFPIRQTSNFAHTGHDYDYVNSALNFLFLS